MRLFDTSSRKEKRDGDFFAQGDATRHQIHGQKTKTHLLNHMSSIATVESNTRDENDN